MSARVVTPRADPRTGAQPVRTALAAAAVLTSAWPLGHLFTATPWTGAAVLQVLVVAGVGLGLRALRMGASVVAAVQFAAIILTQAIAFPARGAPLGGLLPTPATVGHWRDLGAEAARIIMENAAPAPAPPGIAFAISGAVAVVAWAVDVVAVGARMPAVAGLPLLTPFLTAVANSSAPLPPQDAVVPLSMWALMMLEQERDWLSSWRPDLAVSHRLPARGRRLAAGAGVAGAAIAVGLAAAGNVPHLPQRYLADGLGRGDFSRGHRVGFSPSSDMLLDLRSGDQTPVLTYRTDDPNSPPLRVSVASRYAAGSWSPDRTSVRPSQTPELPLPDGLDEETPRIERHIRVDQTGLSAPYLAAPVPLVGGSVVGARWAVQDISGIPVVDGTPRSYDLTYLAVAPTPQQLEVSTLGDYDFFAPWLAVPEEETSPVLFRTARALTEEASSPYDAAVRIQDWLRDTGDFTYSLQLAPTPPGMSPQLAIETAVDRFLTTKRGYCVQFATAMTLMARSQGIPARMATGFLPGRVDGDRHVVVAADAHAWPELYFEGAGWLRFEPTPSVRSGALSSYAMGTTPTSTASTATATVTQTASAPEITQQEREDTDTAPDAGTDTTSDAFSWWPLLQGAALLAALLSVVPATAAAVRTRRREKARDAADAAEAEWLILSERLEDLGLAVPTAATPRQLHLRLTDAAVLDRDASVALSRVLQAVEDARYAAPAGAIAHTEPGTAGERANGRRGGVRQTRRELRQDASTVVKGASSLRSVSSRARAVLIPRAGLRALRLPVPTRRGDSPRH